MGKHNDVFAGIFVACAGIQIPTLHEKCRETLNPHVGTGTSTLNMQVVFVSSLFQDVYDHILCCFREPLSDVTH